MKKQTLVFGRITFFLGILAMAGTVYTMGAIQIFNEQVFLSL
jgi:hypothetical protein